MCGEDEGKDEERGGVSDDHMPSESAGISDLSF